MIDAAASPITETKEHHHRPFLPQPPVVPTEIHTHPAGSESNRPGDEILAAMTAAATTTRPTACRPTSADTPKHAFALIAPFRPRNSTANNVTLPAQRHNLDLWPVGLASETSRHDFYVSVGAGSQTAVLVHNCPGMIGEDGTQVTSRTLTQNSDYHIDVENPDPGGRPGQIHLQDYAGNKYQYNFDSGEFDGLPNSLAKSVANNPAVPGAIARGLSYLGMSQ
jgi:hypothetical protein